MNISELSIRRPVLATVLTAVIILFGVVGYSSLGIREYPSVDNPIISVSTSYPGANADVMDSQITEPLEQEINGIPGLRTLSSFSSQGISRIRAEFELSVDMETAANDVRDKVSRAQSKLPDDCDAPTVVKSDDEAEAILTLTLESEIRSLLELSELADRTVKQQLQTISDVSSVSILGEKEYAMRLWLDPIKMAGYNITPLDIRDAIARENVELPSGSVEGNTIELSIRTMGQISTVSEFNNLIIREDQGRIIRLSDIGRAELGASDIKSYFKMNGVPMVAVSIVPQPGANHIAIADAIYERMAQMSKDLPEDVKYSITFDNTQFIRASIGEVIETIYIALLLVVIIIFLFLRDWRVTIVPCIVIPVSLIGAFFVMYALGFSINVLTMLAIVLSVGLVVDDAIVMTENIYIRIERGMDPFDAGIEGAQEIFFAVISTTITLVAVFFPIVFMEGTTGKLFREFSMVITGSVVISSFAALTITPMLSTKLLKRREKKSWFYSATEPFFEGLNYYYDKTLSGFLSIRWLALAILVVMIGMIAVLWPIIPAEMAPLEDRSQLRISTMGPEGVTYEYMRNYNEEITQMVEDIVPDADYVLSRVMSSRGYVDVGLKPISDRNYSQMDVAAAVTKAVQSKTAARSFVRQTASFSSTSGGGGGAAGGMPIQYVLQTTSLDNMERVLPEFIARVDSDPVFTMSTVNLKFSKPEVKVVINRDKANLMGVSALSISQTLQYGLSGQRLSYFTMNGKQYSIYGEINRQQRNKPSDLKSLYVRSSNGDMISLDNLVTLEPNVSPPTLYRYNRFLSATVSAGLSDGYTIADGIEAMDVIAKEVLDDTFRTSLTGEAQTFQESASSLMFAFMLALVLIYLVLSAQFESFKDPFIIMLTVPMAIVGALFSMWAWGITMNIFSQIGIIMLLGLVVKNGILIVEFANQKQSEGEDKMTAILMASKQRLRPILMTSASTILGLVPLAIASGEGSNQRIAMGVSVIGGLVVSTFMSMYIIPAIYSYLSTDRSKEVAKRVSETIKTEK